tara:strand:+ start:1286 stop:1927 length:642 start_codon:yes stop_codon:yes gene_type:complete
MNRAKRVFFSLNHDTDYGVYQEMLAWLSTEGIEVKPWTTTELSHASRDADRHESNAHLIEQVIRSDYVVVIVGNTQIDAESVDTRALNTAAWMKRPMIALNINQRCDIDEKRFPSLIADQLILHIPMEGQTFNHALESWRDEAFRFRAMGQIGPAHYTEEIYSLIEKTKSPLHRFESASEESVDKSRWCRPLGCDMDDPGSPSVGRTHFAKSV